MDAEWPVQLHRLVRRGSGLLDVRHPTEPVCDHGRPLDASGLDAPVRRYACSRVQRWLRNPVGGCRGRRDHLHGQHEVGRRQDAAPTPHCRTLRDDHIRHEHAVGELNADSASASVISRAPSSSPQCATSVPYSAFVQRHVPQVIVPLATVKARLSEFVSRVSGQHERVTVTVQGRPSAVLRSVEDLESLAETLAVLADTDAIRRMAAS